MLTRTPTFAGGGITPAEKVQMDNHANLWISRAMRTAPIDPQEIVPAIKSLYAAAGLKEPRVVIVPSPAVMAFAGGFASAIWHMRKSNATYNATYNATDNATANATDNATDNATRNATYNEHWEYSLALDIFGNRNDALFALRTAQGWWQQYQGGNMWAAWDSYISAARDILGLTLPEHEKYSAWEQCAIHGGFRYMHEEFCMVCDFPDIITKDAANRPHGECGPSHRWRDGWQLFHWHGVRIDESKSWIITDPTKITAEKIDKESNSEIKRVMLERFGYDRFLTETGATVVDECPADHPLKGARTGRLLVKEVGDEEPICMLDVLNSTPEPDGTTKRYMLLVDPKAYGGKAGKDVVAALASTWRNHDGGLHFKTPEDYAPHFES